MNCNVAEDSTGTHNATSSVAVDIFVPEIDRVRDVLWLIICTEQYEEVTGVLVS